MLTRVVLCNNTPTDFFPGGRSTQKVALLSVGSVDFDPRTDLGSYEWDFARLKNVRASRISRSHVTMGSH